MNILETRELAVGYDNKAVVEGINFEILKGQIIAILGPNGAGKSTILKSLSSLLAPIKGAIHIQDRDLFSIKRKSLSKILAVVLTERLNAGFLSAFDIAAMGRYPHTGFLGNLTEADKELVWQCLREVHAQNLACRPFNELSDGEKQKIMLARALAQEPEMIILDEPTTHLDIKHKLEVMSILKKLSREKGITVIFSLHEIDLALKSCDTAILVKGGKIVDFGFPEKVGSNESISALFDMDGAGFSSFMGTIEISNQGVPVAFVVGGGGTSTEVYRLFTRNNVGFYTGILHENDVDYHIAKTIGVDVVVEKPFKSIGTKAIERATYFLNKTSLVVDTGFPIDEINKANQMLVAEALLRGKCVCTLREEKENKRIYGELSEKLTYCDSIRDLLKHCEGLGKCRSSEMICS